MSAVAGAWLARCGQACLFGACPSIIIANQITQIAHVVTQVGKMVDQLYLFVSVLNATTELATSNDVGMDNIGRLWEVTDGGWLFGHHGCGLSTSMSTGGAGAFQRIPGVTDESGWLDVLAAWATRRLPQCCWAAGRGPRPRRPQPSAFHSWTAPTGPA